MLHRVDGWNTATRERTMEAVASRVIACIASAAASMRRANLRYHMEHGRPTVP